MDRATAGDAETRRVVAGDEGGAMRSAGRIRAWLSPQTKSAGTRNWCAPTERRISGQNAPGIRRSPFEGETCALLSHNLRITCALLSHRLSGVVRSCPAFVRPFEGEPLGISLHSASCGPAVCPLFVRRLSAVCPAFVRRLPGVCPLFARRLSAVCPAFVRRLPGVCPLFVSATFNLSSTGAGVLR